MLRQQIDVSVNNWPWNQTVKSETSDALKANVETFDVSDDVAAWQQFRESHFWSTFGFSKMVRRDRISVESKVGAGIHSRQIIFECFSHDVVEILPRCFARNVSVRNDRLGRAILIVVKIVGVFQKSVWLPEKNGDFNFLSINSIRYVFSWRR